MAKFSLAIKIYFKLLVVSNLIEIRYHIILLKDKMPNGSLCYIFFVHSLILTRSFFFVIEETHQQNNDLQKKKLKQVKRLYCPLAITFVQRMCHTHLNALKFKYVLLTYNTKYVLQYKYHFLSKKYLKKKIYKNSYTFINVLFL